jgi:hypothetical protein
MTVTVPAQLEAALRQKAAERQTSVEQLVQEALAWYLRTDGELLDELTAWQEVRDEAAEIVEGTPP